MSCSRLTAFVCLVICWCEVAFIVEDPFVFESSTTRCYERGLV